MTVEVTDLNLTQEEIQILILESAVEASRKYEESKFADVIKANRAWDESKNSLDRLNRALEKKRDEFLRRAV